MKNTLNSIIETVSVTLLVTSAPIWVTFWVLGLFKPEIWFWFKRLTNRILAQQPHIAGHLELWSAGMTRPQGIYLGTLKTGVFRRSVNIYAHHESSVVMIAPRGGGKSTYLRRVIEDYARRRERPDLIVVDPVREHRRALERVCGEAGWVPVTIDVADRDTTRYSPFAEMDITRPSSHTEILNLCYSLIPDDPNDRNSHFRDVPRILLAASMVYHLSREPDKATLQHCLASLVADQKELLALFKKFESMPYDDTLRHALKIAQTVKEKEYGSFVTSTSKYFRPFQDPAWQRLTQPGGNGDNGWSFEDVYRRRQPTVFFLSLGSDSLITGPATRLLISNALYTRKRMMHEGFAFPRALTILADEPKGMGDCKAFVMAQDELRKARVNICLPFLTVDDIHNTYTEPESILQGSTLLIAGNISNQRTIDYASKMAGHGDDGKSIISAKSIYALPFGNRLMIGNRLVSVLDA